MCIYFIADLIMFAFVMISFSPIRTGAANHLVVQSSTTLQKRRNKMFMLSCIMLTMIWGFRSYTTGGDTPEYANFIMGINGFFGNITHPREDLESGFLCIMKFVLFFTQNPTVVFCLQTFCLFGIIYKLYKYVNPQNSTWCLLFYFVFHWNMMTLVSVAFRQAISATILLYGVYLMEKNYVTIKEAKIKIYRNKKFIVPLLIMLLAATVHKATLVLFPLLIVAFLVRINKKTAYILVLITLLISLFFSNLISTTFDLLMNTFSSSQSDVLNHMSYYSETLSDGVNTLVSSLLRSLIFFSIIYYTDKEKIGTVYFNGLIIMACLFNIFSASEQAGRLLFVFSLLCGCMYIPSVTQRKWKPRILFLMFTLLYMYRAYSAFATWTSVNIGDTTLPYYFFWEK